MKVFDFDGTVYAGDSSVDFYCFSICRHPSLVRYLPLQIGSLFLFVLGVIDKTRFKEGFFSFLRGLKDPWMEIRAFWKENMHKLKPHFVSMIGAGDLVASASPEFLLKPICEEYGMKLIASRVDISSGVFCGVNCWGVEKARRFTEEFPCEEIDEFYTDSRSDVFMAEMAKKSFLVTRSGLEPFPF